MKETTVRRGDVKFVRREDGVVEVWVFSADGDSVWCGLGAEEWADVVAAFGTKAKQPCECGCHRSFYSKYAPIHPPSKCGCEAPVPDKAQEHRTDGKPCWCNPDVYPGSGNDGDVIVHRRTDQ